MAEFRNEDERVESLAARGTDTFSAGAGRLASLGTLTVAGSAAEKVSVP
jgi:hypothetical protein